MGSIQSQINKTKLKIEVILDHWAHINDYRLKNYSSHLSTQKIIRTYASFDSSISVFHTHTPGIS